MTRRGEEPKEPVQIHDHFDGSGNCVECGGKCQLRGADRIATELVRWHFEEWARDVGFPTEMAKGTMRKAGVDFQAFMRRAKETDRKSPYQPPLIDRLGTRKTGEAPE